ncbi:MAG: hypothetical protein KAI77_03685, partial [Gammaproteobacteria bacterium]|nr:hypothetical protein [Gammaproteobacteria bacterium]
VNFRHKVANPIYGSFQVLVLFDSDPLIPNSTGENHRNPPNLAITAVKSILNRRQKKDAYIDVGSRKCMDHVIDTLMRGSLTNE